MFRKLSLPAYNISNAGFGQNSQHGITHVNEYIPAAAGMFVLAFVTTFVKIQTDAGKQRTGPVGHTHDLHQFDIRRVPGEITSDSRSEEHTSKIPSPMCTSNA